MTSVAVREFSIGAGTVYVDDQPLGATREGNMFRIVQDITAPTINGAGGILATTDYHNAFPMAELEVTLVELTEATLPYMIPGAETDTSGDDLVVGPPLVRRIQPDSYHKWEVRVPGIAGRTFKYTILLGIVTGNAEFNNADDGTAPAGPRLTIQSRIDPDDITAAPWNITRTPPTYS